MPSAQAWTCKPQEQVRANLKLKVLKCASHGCQVCVSKFSALQSPSCWAALPADAHTLPPRILGLQNGQF